MPPAFTRKYALLVSAFVRPARWYTTSQSASAAVSNSLDDVTSPWTNVRGKPSSASSLDVLRTRQRTSSPRSTSARTRCVPMKPLAPVTKHFAIETQGVRHVLRPGRDRHVDETSSWPHFIQRKSARTVTEGGALRGTNHDPADPQPNPDESGTHD